MKKLVFIITTLLLLAATARGNDIVAEFQKKYEKEAEFTVINISPKMFQLMGAMVDDEEKSIIQDLTGLRMLTSEKNTKKYYNDAMKMLTSSKYEELMSVEDGKDNVRMFTMEKGGIISSLIILIEDDEEFVMIGISGDIDLKKISSLSKTLKIDKLEKIDSK